MKHVKIQSLNSIVEATNDAGDTQRLAHGMNIGRLPELSDEEYHALCELMLGYDDFKQGRFPDVDE